LQCVECCGRRTEQDGVAVVQRGSDDTASHCLSEIVGQQTTHVAYSASVVVARPRLVPGVTVEPQVTTMFLAKILLSEEDKASTDNASDLNG